MSTKQWEEPRLLILGQGKPEERVLDHPNPCKVLPGGGPGQADASCTNHNPCIACQLFS